MNDKENLLSESEVAEVLGCSQRALANWRRKGMGPVFIRLSEKQIRYRKVDLDAWLVEISFNDEKVKVSQVGGHYEK